MKPSIYIAGPYTNPDPVTNTRAAIDVGMQLADLGYAVEIPHLTHFVHLIHPRGIDYWYDFDLRKLEYCTHLLRLPGESTGADAEVAHAWDNEIAVYYDINILIADLREGHNDTDNGRDVTEGEAS